MFDSLLLNERLLKALEKLSLSNPTPIQQEMIPMALQGHDIQASAETGSGKTAAYLLPLLQRMLDKPSPNTATRTLILLPTRELALQVDKHCRDLAAFTLIKSIVIVGGTSYTEQKANLRKNPEIIIGTPGRILEHVGKKTLELGELEYLVLDEADRMLDMGFRDDVMSIVESCAKERQTYLLSATLQHSGIGKIAKEVLSTPKIIAIGTHRSQHANIKQQIVLADDAAHKKQLSSWILAHGEYEKALVFTNTREHAQQLADFLQSQRDKHSGADKLWGKAGKSKTKVAYLHGEMEQDERKKIMHWFREGAISILVATDLAARGLDVKGVDLVLNYAIARSGDDYVHRIGRTGRAGHQGLAISLVSPQEWNSMSSIERYLGLAFEQISIEGLEARFQGPAKKSGTQLKAAKKAKKEKDKHSKSYSVPKAKQRHSYKKNIGKRRVKADAAADLKGKAAAAPESTLMDNAGMAPVKRKKAE